MSTWILLFWIVAGQGSGVGSAEFSSKKACEAALEQLPNTLMARGRGICVPKGD